MKKTVLICAAVAASFVCGMAVQAARANDSQNERVTGIGGIFFKAHDAPKLAAWYREHLRITSTSEPATFHSFEWLEKENPSTMGVTVWAIFPETTKYFGQSKSPVMINYRVANLDRMLAQLREEGVEVDSKIDTEANGRFGWATDPEGNRFELWEPK